MLFEILKALAGKPENKKPQKKTQAQIDKEKRVNVNEYLSHVLANI